MTATVLRRLARDLNCTVAALRERLSAYEYAEQLARLAIEAEERKRGLAP